MEAATAPGACSVSRPGAAGPPGPRAGAAGFKGTALYVDVDHSARLHDLTLRKPQLLKKLNGYLIRPGAKAPVSDIIFKISDDNER